MASRVTYGSRQAGGTPAAAERVVRRRPCADAARAGATFLTALVLALVFAAAAFAAGPLSQPDPDTWITNGIVNAVVVAADGTTYIGGDFTYVGPNTGCGAPLNGSGSVIGASLLVDGRVSATVADGSGGFYIGGSFTSVGGEARGRLAHILSDGSLDPGWDPGANADDSVRALAVSGDTVYVGGGFSRISCQPRDNIAALDASTGDAKSWNPDADSTVYAGGAFTAIGGQSRSGIAALDASTGAATAWNPDANGSVYALAVSGGTVYAGGAFGTIGGETCPDFAAFRLPQFTLTPSVTGGHGAISPATLQTVDEGATPTFSFTPDPGYELDRVLVDGSAVTPTAENEYTFPAVEADHTISVSFSATVGPPPVTTVSGATGGWSKRPVTLRFTAEPGSGGAPVAYTEYRIGNGSWTTGTSVRVTRQGATRVWYRSADTLGGLETARSCMVRLDSRRPGVRVKSGTLRARAGSSARLRYYVRDPRPGCGFALVRLVVSDARGRILTRSSARPMPTNSWRTVRVSTRALRPGTYRVALRAVDKAGNFQRGLTSTTLRVR